MRHNHRADLFFAFFEVAGVGDYIVDARRFVVGEEHAGVDHDDVITDLDRGHVLADLFHAAERYDTDHAWCWRCYCRLALGPYRRS